MQPERYPPDDPREWLNRARSNLALAQSDPPRGAYTEDLLFDAQQAAEKAIKAVFIVRGVTFPFTHDIRTLLNLLRSSGQDVPRSHDAADRLTRFAHEARYPGAAPPVTHEEYLELVAIAKAVVAWAERRVAAGA